MKRILLTLSVMFVLFFSGQVVWGQVPQTMSYQGVLTDAKGTLVSDGVYRITFKLYTTAQGGTPVWSETQSVVVKNALFNAALGSANPLDIPFDKPYWLAITVGEGSEVTQRMELTSSAYSLLARSVADNAITSRKIAEGQVVKSINSMTDDVALAAGENVTITQEGNLLIISANLDEFSTGDIEDNLASKRPAPPRDHDQMVCMGNFGELLGRPTSYDCQKASEQSTIRFNSLFEIFSDGWRAISVGGFSSNSRSIIIFYK